MTKYTDEQIDEGIEFFSRKRSDHFPHTSWDVDAVSLYALKQLKANRWRDIESAPKDGREILAFEEGVWFVCRWEEGGWFSGDYAEPEGLAHPILSEPTHWKPITPPTEDDDE